MKERLELAVNRRRSLGARERRQEVAHFCGWFGDGAAGRRFAANMGGLCHQLCEVVGSCWSLSCIHFQLFFARVLSAHEEAAITAVDRKPQERVSPRKRLHCYIGKMRWKEQRSRRVVLAFLKTLFPSFYQPFSSVYLLFQQPLLGLFIFPSTDAWCILIMHRQSPFLGSGRT